MPGAAGATMRKRREKALLEQVTEMLKKDADEEDEETEEDSVIKQFEAMVIAAKGKQTRPRSRRT